VILFLLVSICEVLEHTCGFLFLLIHFFIFKVLFLVGLVFCRMMAMLDVGIHQSSGEPFSFFSFYCGGLIF